MVDNLLNASAPTITAPPTRAVSQRRLMALLLVANMALYAVYGGIGGILLPIQVENIDEAAKVANLGLIGGIAAVFATLFNPIGGALSDRTRSRFGRRAPWLVGASLTTLAALIPLGQAKSIALIAVLWCAAQSVANVYQAALTAVVPDRVPEHRRGTASAVAGAGMSLGLLSGIVIAGRFTDAVSTGYLTLGLILVATALLLVALTRDPSAPEPVPSTAKRKGAALSALKDADFRWVFIGRALIVLGYFMVLGYLLYLLEDHIGLPAGMKGADGVALLTGIMTVAMLIASVVGGPLSDRLDRRKAFVFVSSVTSAVALLLPLLSPSWTTMIAFMVLNGLAFGVYMSVDTAIVTLVLPNAGDAARDMGVLNIANAGPQIAAPFVASVVIGQFGYTTLFLASAVLALGGALAILPVKGVR